MNEARAKLLSSILTVLGVSAGSCAPIVAPDSPEDKDKVCPQSNYYAAKWPEGEELRHGKSTNAVCLPKPAGGECSSYPKACVLKRYVCGLQEGGEEVVDTLPSKEPDMCCWEVKGTCAIGRPFVVDGEVRLASLALGDGWSSAVPPAPAALDPSVREALADVWARDGLTEHASVASFAQLTLELLALGAPAELVRGAQEAMADEIRHAERAFALASGYAGRAIGPGPLDTHGIGRAPVLADFAARAAAEGCIAETVASLQLHAAAAAAVDNELANELRLTAEEESTHALLAYRIVAWAIAKGGDEVRAAVHSVFERAADHIGFGPFPDEALDLRDHGVLSRSERHDLAVQALREVIVPAGRALLGRDVAARAARGSRASA
ncbi:MAG: ferritin-like domain-containing protein [Polyangiaceae bacterium]|nr:ferritin-like domain-containing protein [Polyangiaceae bacterium]